jgi:diacylglycerol kinase (ATP)
MDLPSQSPLDNKKIFIIMNPNSGAQKRGLWWVRRLLGIKDVKHTYESKEALLKGVVQLFNDHGIEAYGDFTNAPGHATALAKKAVHEGVSTIVVVGGDGTINEVVNGMAHTNVALGVIPFGTANVFGLAFNLSMNVQEACKNIVFGTIKKIDLGKINDTYFACMAGVGFDAFVIQKADKKLKKMMGALSYVLIAFWEILKYQFYPILFTIDGELTPKKGYFLIISNTKYYGGDFIVAPNARPNDGKLDACIFTGHGLIKAIWYGVQMKLGRLSKSADVQCIQCESLKIRQFGHHSIHADAEYIGQCPATITIEKKALTIVH